MLPKVPPADGQSISFFRHRMNSAGNKTVAGAASELKLQTGNPAAVEGNNRLVVKAKFDASSARHRSVPTQQRHRLGGMA